MVYSASKPNSFAISFNTYPPYGNAAFIGTTRLSFVVSVPSCWFIAGISRSPSPSAERVKSAGTLYPTVLPSAASSRSQISEIPIAFPAGGTQTTLNSAYCSSSAISLAICTAFGCA